MSIQLKMIKKQMQKQGQTFGAGFDVEAVRKAAAASAQMPPEKGVSFEDVMLGERPTELITPKNPREDAVILYIHGGGMVSGNPKYLHAFTSFLAKTSGMKVYATTYRLAPEYKFPIGTEDCFAAYQALTELVPDKKIFLFGESGGATMVIVTTLRARDGGIRMPDAVVACAPCGDLTGKIDRSPYKDTDMVVGYGAIDSIRDVYCPDDVENPYASPCLADYTNFPPLRLVWDKGESLSPDSRIIAEKAQKAGVTLETKEWEGTFHTFQMLARMIPEAADDVKDSVKFYERWL